MSADYYVMYNPLTFNLMDVPEDSLQSPVRLLSYLTGRDALDLANHNYAEYLDFDLARHRSGMVETLAIETYAAQYVGNQIARLAPKTRVIHADDKRRTIRQIVDREGVRPRAVFITSMSSNFPTAAAASIILNHGRIPVVIGGIHVSTSPADVDTFIRGYCPHPQLVSCVRGAGDSSVVSEILHDLVHGALQPEYTGNDMIEDSVWGDYPNIDPLPPMQMECLRRFPLLGSYLARRIKINPVAPFLGCPYSCKFCSISSLPKPRRTLVVRDTDDFLAELEHCQRDGVDLASRFFFFLPDNLLLGGSRLPDLMNAIIERGLKVNFAVQVSIEIASDRALLQKLRLAGATHFFIGFESLDIRNLRYIGKHCVKAIGQSGLSVREYYARQIKTIQDYGVSIHGAFIFGLPYDYFRSFADHTGRETADFCIQHRIGLQPALLTDLPGSQLFEETQRDRTWLYGEKGTMAYLTSLCVTDVSESNRIPPESLGKSPIRTECIAFEAIRRAGATRRALRNAMFMMRKSFRCPTARGRDSLKERLIDAFFSATSQLVVSLYRDHAERIMYSSDQVRGTMERLYDLETDPDTKAYFKNYVARFRRKTNRRAAKRERSRLWSRHSQGTDSSAP